MEEEQIPEEEHNQFVLPKDHIEIELISQGAHGCIYRPNINCDTGEPEDINYISKIQTNTKNIQNEINISNAIKTIDNYFFYFAPILSNCKTTISKIKETEIKKCNLFNDKDESTILKTGELISTKMRYIGSDTLESYLLKLFKANVTNSSRKSSTIGGIRSNELSIPPNKKDLIYKKIYQLYVYLLHSVRLLLEKDIVHYDLKENNIMYNLDSNTPIIIDYGNSFIVSDIKTKETRREYFYSDSFYLYWPIEVQFLSHISVNDLYEKPIDESGIQKVLDKFFNNLFDIQKKYNMYISQSELTDFKTKLTEYFKPYVGSNWEKMYTDFLLPEIYKTWDLYSLSITFLSSVYEVLKEKTPVNTVSFTSNKENNSNLSSFTSDNSNKSEKITNSEENSKKESAEEDKKENGSILSSISNFFTPKENKESESGSQTKKGGDNTPKESPGLISSIVNSIPSTTQKQNNSTETRDSVSETMVVQYPEELDIKGILPMSKSIDLWKSVVLSIPSERPSIDTIMEGFTYPKGK